MDWKVEVGKLAGSALLGFFFGRLQTSYTDKVGRAKDIQNELLKSIRSCATSAIDYHSKTLAKDQWAAKSFHLKHQLLRIRTDVFEIKKICKRSDDVLPLCLLEFLDAVTAFPFEAHELPEEIEKSRFALISLTSEKLVQELATCRPTLF